jgi:hypothetical protein
MTKLLALLATLPLAACGGDPLEPGAGDDPGTGSGTLRVDADITAEGLIDNASEASDFATELHVRVEKGGGPVVTGSVVVTSAGGSVELTYDANDNDGRWRGAQAGYHEVYELAVVSGDDYVDGVRLDGPALHRFTAPTAGSTVDATQPLEVTWEAAEAADTASLRTEEIDEISIADEGRHVLPVGSLKSKETEVEQEELRLRRSARLTPAGAVAGSELRVEVSNRIELIVAPTQ